MLALGEPCLSLVPLDELDRALRTAVRAPSRSALTYGEVQGHLPLRRAILDFHSDYYGLDDTDRILLTHGASEGIALTARHLLRRHDVVLVEAPTYRWALSEFVAQGARLVEVAVDEHGMDVDDLAAVIRRLQNAGERPRLIYTMPTFQNPTGLTLSPARRLRLLKIAAESGIWILEDDSYFPLRYAGTGVPPLVALDTEGLVIHVSTFSKVLAPGIRLGWLIGSAPVVREILALKQNGANPLLAEAVYHFMTAGHLAVCLPKLRTFYGESLRICVEALSDIGEHGATVSTPQGGFYLWLRLPGAWAVGPFAEYCAGNGIRVYSGDDFFCTPPAAPYLRIAFSGTEHGPLREHIVRFVHLLHAYPQARPRRGEPAAAHGGCAL